MPNHFTMPEIFFPQLLCLKGKHLSLESQLKAEIICDVGTFQAPCGYFQTILILSVSFLDPVGVESHVVKSYCPSPLIADFTGPPTHFSSWFTFNLSNTASVIILGRLQYTHEMILSLTMASQLLKLLFS